MQYFASIVEELVVAFDERLKNGQRRDRKNVRRSMENPWPDYDPEITPSWTALVPPIQEENLRDLPSDMVQND